MLYAYLMSILPYPVRAGLQRRCATATRLGCLYVFGMFWGLWAIATTANPDTVEAGHRVGLADDREGYERTDYSTRSEAVLTQKGARLPLAQLANQAPLGLPPLPEVLDEREVDLGRRLFFDRRLSANANLSCAMCHVPEQGFTQNELATPVGDEGRGGRRNAPSLYNVGYQKALFWDGREGSLEAQVWSPLLARNEMANSSRQAVLSRLQNIPELRNAFSVLYPDGLTESTLGRAMAAYQRSLSSAGSAFDQWYFGAESGDSDAAPSLDPLAYRGFSVFQETGCQSCHRVGKDHALFTDHDFHNTGTGHQRVLRGSQPQQVQVAPGVFINLTVSVETETFTDDGRIEVTGNADDQWRYRTPSLRNVALTAPYMHDGSLGTLEAVVAFYNRGGGNDPNRDPRIRPLGLSDRDQQALVAFLESLTAANVDALVSDARSVAVGDTQR